MKIKHIVFVVLIFVICNAFIITRHDIDSQRYIDFGKNDIFQSLVEFDDGNGTLINEEWVITAYHVARHQKPGNLVTLNGSNYKIAEVVLYPQKKAKELTELKDIALIKLNKSVIGVTPAKYADEMPKPDELIFLAGTGDTGTGRTGPKFKDSKKRGATNRIDTVNNMHIMFAFDNPENGKATDLEGISGPGDSGGPAYLKKNGELVIVGISSFQVVPNGGKEGHYGVVEHYHNIYPYREWIEATLRGDEYYKSIMDGKEIVSIKRSNGSYYLGVNGKKATTEEIINYGEKILNELQMVKASSKDNLVDVNDPILVFRKYIEDISGVTDVNKVGGFVLDKNELIVGDKKLSEEIKNKALVKFEELFGQPIGNNRINAKPSNN